MRQNANLRLIDEIFRRLTKIVSRVFHEILKTMNDFYLHEIKLFTIETSIFYHIRKLIKF